MRRRKHKALRAEIVKDRKHLVSEFDLTALLLSFAETIEQRPNKIAALKTLVTFTKKYVPKLKVTRGDTSKALIAILYKIGNKCKLNMKEQSLVSIALKSLI
jgi:hypothetical protein